MTDEIHFCPYCGSQSHKIACFGKLFFCRECNRFFNLEETKLKCPKCRSASIADSEFPSPTGEMVLQCRRCKKMFSVGEFVWKNNIK